MPSGFMNPTILEGDRLLVDKHVYGLRVPFTLSRLTEGNNPARGDIIVFDSPTNGRSLVKRVIAVPGDTVELDGERLIVNGASPRYTVEAAPASSALLRSTRALEPTVLRESGSARAHDILLLPGRIYSERVGPLT
ncbi:MAG: signal peptidase I, partial [Terriglobales bacterium]